MQIPTCLCRWLALRAQAAKKAQETTDAATKAAKEAAAAAAAAAASASAWATNSTKQSGKKVDGSSEGAGDAGSSSTEQGSAHSASAGASEEEGKAAPKPKPKSFMHTPTGRVLAGVLGMRVPKDVAAGEGYEWYEYLDSESGKMVYRSSVTGSITDIKPHDFDEMADAVKEATGRDAHRIVTNTEAASLEIVRGKRTRFQMYSDMLLEQPIIQGVLAAADEVGDSAAGQAVQNMRKRAREVREDLETKLETSQHPLVYNAHYAYSTMFAESDHGRGMTTMLALDPGFNEADFVEEMTEEIVPNLVTAFLRGDRKMLEHLCTPSGLMGMKPVLKQREAEGVHADPTVLSVDSVDLYTMRQEAGNTPIAVATCQVQQIHCIRNAAGEVVEGSEDTVKQVTYMLAMQRQWDEGGLGLVWRVAEVSMTDGQLYL